MLENRQFTEEEPQKLTGIYEEIFKIMNNQKKKAN